MRLLRRIPVISHPEPLSFLLTAALAIIAPLGMTAPAAQGEWRLLFDGETLTGWLPTEFGGEGRVQVAEGRIVLGFGDPLTGVTYTGPDLPILDYEIALDAMRIKGGDFFCGLTFPVGDSHCSLILGGWGGATVGLSSLDGRDASENETTQYVRFEEGRWYAVRVRVTRDRIEAWLDERPIVSVDTHGRKITIRPEVAPSRPLGIASYQTRAALRNIRLRRVPSR